MAEIRTVAVIGAGSLGRGIALAAALGGYRTILEDILPASLRRAEGEIRATLDQAIQLGRVSHAEADAAHQRIEFAGSVEEAAREADLVIEAVPEEMESKIEIFTLLDKVCRPATILVSTTLAFSVTEIASVTYRAAKCLGMRFDDSMEQVERLEVIRGRETDDATVSAVTEVGRRMGKEVAVRSESLDSLPARVDAVISN